MAETNCSTDETQQTTALAGARGWRFAPWWALAVLVLASVVWIELLSWRQMKRLHQQFAEADLDSFYLGLQLRETIQRMNSTLLRFQLSDAETERANFQREAQSFSESIGRMKARLGTRGDGAPAAEIERAFARYLADTAEYLERGARGIRRETAATLHNVITNKSEPVVLMADRVVAAQRSAVENFFSGSQTAIGSLQKSLQLSILLLLLLVASLITLLYRGFVTPLRLQLSVSEAAVARQEKLASLGILAAGVAHEIRNPLTAIKFRLFSLKKDLGAALASHEDLLTIDGEVNRLERIVKDFLQFARPAEPQLGPISLHDLLKQVRDLLAPEFEARQIRLSVEAGEPIQLRADSQQLQQVLINLVQNAADSIGRDGMITLRARQGAHSFPNRREPVVILEVSDTGKGIPPEVEKRLFDPFFSTKEGGTGLGLAIASRIIEKHGGFIQYLTRPNHGTTFSIVLPQQVHHESTHSPN